MNAVNAMWQAIGQRGAAPTAGMSPAALVNALVGMVGSGRSAARILGVSPSTVYRWQAGKSQPKIGTRGIVAGMRAYALATAPQDLLRHVGPGGLELHIHGTFAVSSDTRTRTIAAGKYVSRAKMLNVIKSWMAGDDARYSRLLDRALGADYANGIAIVDIDQLWFT